MPQCLRGGSNINRRDVAMTLWMDVRSCPQVQNLLFLRVGPGFCRFLGAPPRQVGCHLAPSLRQACAILAPKFRPVSCVLCLAFCVLCPVSGVLYPVSCVLCPVSCVLCPVSCVLCPVSCVLCPVSCVMCPVSCILCPVSCVLCDKDDALRQVLGPACATLRPPRFLQHPNR